jgi:hypothetical protein
MEVAEVSGNDEVNDLTRTISGRFIAGRPATKHDMDVLGPIPLFCDVVLARYLPSVLA